MLARVTTAVQSLFSYVPDPSGTELRRALIRPDCDVVWVDPAVHRPLAAERAQILLAVVASLTCSSASLASPSAERGPT